MKNETTEVGAREKLIEKLKLEGYKNIEARLFLVDKYEMEFFEIHPVLGEYLDEWATIKMNSAKSHFTRQPPTREELLKMAWNFMGFDNDERDERDEGVEICGYEYITERLADFYLSVNQSVGDEGEE